jgi:hypothetical protein
VTSALDPITTITTITTVRDRCLPVDGVFARLLPDGGLRRGHVVGCSGPAAMTLALGLTARAVAAGSWLAVVGVPMLGVEAVAELGIPLERVVAVAAEGGPSVWAERVAAAADGFDLVLTHPPAGADRMARRIRTRVQARGGVLVAVGATTPGMPCDVEATTTSVAWLGVGAGAGHLIARRAGVRFGGRRIPRPAETDLLLPGPDGRIADLDASAGARTDPTLEQTVLEQAG